MSQFKDQSVIVTGASRGIGYAIAMAFAQEGANVAICSTNSEKAQQVAKEISEKTSSMVVGYGVDICQPDQVSEFVASVNQQFTRIDCLVNNAGITRDNLLLRLSNDEWSSVIDTNLNSLYTITKSTVKIMLKQKYGRIINMASVVGQMGNPGQSNYAAAKGGMIAFTKATAKEFAKKNITVNAIAPGFIETDMTKNLKTLPNDYLDNIINNVPMKRLGTPEDVAASVLFLASKSASYITGQVINVDGGLVM